MDLADRLAVLEATVARLEVLVERQAAEIVLKDRALIAQQDRIAEMERALEDARRGGKCQAAPFSKGNVERQPKRPGRKRGDAHGRHGHRPAPAGPPDRVLEAGLPDACPDCAATVICDRVEEQWQVDIPPTVAATVTRFDIEVGHCWGCGRRVQGRHREQT